VVLNPLQYGPENTREFRNSDPQRNDGSAEMGQRTERSPLVSMLSQRFLNAIKIFISSTQSHNKMAALGYAYTSGKQTLHSPKAGTAQNATGTCFLEVQITPRVLV